MGLPGIPRDGVGIPGRERHIWRDLRKLILSVPQVLTKWVPWTIKMPLNIGKEAAQWFWTTKVLHSLPKQVMNKYNFPADHLINQLSTIINITPTSLPMVDFSAIPPMWQWLSLMLKMTKISFSRKTFLKICFRQIIWHNTQAWVVMVWVKLSTRTPSYLKIDQWSTSK